MTYAVRCKGMGAGVRTYEVDIGGDPIDADKAHREAQFIARAINTHDALVRVLERVRSASNANEVDRVLDAAAGVRLIARSEAINNPALYPYVVEHGYGSIAVYYGPFHTQDAAAAWALRRGFDDWGVLSPKEMT